MSDLSSPASSSLSLYYNDSISVMKSILGICLDAIAKFSPLARTDICPLFKLVLDKFITHLLLVSTCDWELLLFLLSLLPTVLACIWLLWLDLIWLLLLISMLNLFTCLFLILKNLSSLTLLMNLLHWSKSSVFITMDANLELLLFMLFPLCSIVTLMLLTLSCKICFSAFCIISFAPLLILLQDGICLTLTNQYNSSAYTP